MAFLAQQMAKTPLARLMRISWRSVGKILTRVVADKLDRGRLDGLVMIGVDEVSHGAGHKFLTCIADHKSGGVVWAAPGRNAQTLQGFFDELSDEQKASITAVSIDMSAGYEKAIRSPAGLPNAEVCFDPFHVCQLGGKAADQVRRDEYNQHRRSATGEGRWIKGSRYSLLKDTANQTAGQLLKLAEVVLMNKRMYRAFLLLGELRYIYRLPKHEAAERPRGVAGVGVALQAQAVRQASAHDPQAQARRAGRDPARNQQRTTGSAQQPRTTNQPPSSRIPLTQGADRDRLPLLRRSPDRPPSPMSHPQTGRRADYVRWRDAAGNRAPPTAHVDSLARQNVLRRALVSAASSPVTSRMSKTWAWRMTMWKLERLLFRISGGRLSASPGLPTALLQTRGARTKRVRSTSTIYFHDGASVILIASQAGYPGNLAWYYNLRAHPEARLGGHAFRAEEVTDEGERSRVWELADRIFPAFATYRREAAAHGRSVPVLRLTPR